MARQRFTVLWAFWATHGLIAWGIGAVIANQA